MPLAIRNTHKLHTRTHAHARAHADTQVLGTLPTRLEIKGLPFNVGFEYSLFTLTYVLLQGYGEIAYEAAGSAAADQGRGFVVQCSVYIVY